MANAKKCDRCGEFYTENTVKLPTGFDSPVSQLVFVNYESNHILKRYDLCDECVEKLLGFMNGDETYDPYDEELEEPMEVKMKPPFVYE